MYSMRQGVYTQPHFAGNGVKIEKIKLLGKPSPLEKRCQKIVKSTGTFYYDGNRHRCGRVARLKVDGISFCKQHAGECALNHLILQGTG